MRVEGILVVIAALVLRVRDEGDRKIALVTAKSAERCLSKTYAVDARAGSIGEIDSVETGCR